MNLGIVSFFAILAAVSALHQPRNHGTVTNKAIDDLKSTLEKIKTNLLSMKPTMNAAASFVDAYSTNRIVDTPATIHKAFIQLQKMNIPEPCLQEATKQLNFINAAVVPNCSAIHIVEDAGAVVYNSANFVALSMVMLDDVLGGLQQCSPWYKFWHYIPCVISYAVTSYKDLSSIIGAAFTTYKDNEERANDIVYQIVCKSNQMSSSHSTTGQVINEAYLCAKNSNKII